MSKTKKRITFEEEKKVFPDEWVVFSEPRGDTKTTTFLDGVVYFHGKDHNEAYRKAAKIKGGHAMLYTGVMKYRTVTLRVDDEVSKRVA